MAKKTLGYIISIIGILVFLLTFDTIKASVNIPILDTTTNLVLTVISLALVIAGILIVYKSPSSGKKEKEVPIYKGKEIVGYRRH